MVVVSLSLSLSLSLSISLSLSLSLARARTHTHTHRQRQKDLAIARIYFKAHGARAATSQATSQAMSQPMSRPTGSVRQAAIDSVHPVRHEDLEEKVGEVTTGREIRSIALVGTVLALMTVFYYYYFVCHYVFF